MVENSEEKKKKVFIAYKREQRDEEVARLLKSTLDAEDYDAFLDQVDIVPGTDWGKKTEEELRSASFFIILLSKRAWESENIPNEYNKAKRLGIGLVPIALEQDPEIPLGLMSSLAEIQRIDWFENHDDQDKLDEILTTLIRKDLDKQEQRDRFLARHMIRTNLLRRIKETFVAPKKWDEAVDLLKSPNVIFIAGPDDSGKEFFGLRLAIEAAGEQVAVIRGSQSIPSGSCSRGRTLCLFFPDLTAGMEDDGDALRGLHESFAEWASTGCRVIASCTEDFFLRFDTAVFNGDFEPVRPYRIVLDSESYDLLQKRKIYENQVDFLGNQKYLDSSQVRWAKGLLDKEKSDEIEEADRGRFEQLLMDGWSIGRLGSFVAQDLRQLRDPKEISLLLSEKATMQDRINRWFLGRDESTRVFLLALVLAENLDPPELWDIYKGVVAKLRHFNYEIAIRPLGILVDDASPYVLAEEPYRFANEKFARAVMEEMRRNYREYVLELQELILEWSVPAKQDMREDDQETEGKKKPLPSGKINREEAVQLIGRMGGVRLSDLSPVLDGWADLPNSKLRRMASEALLIAAQESAADPHLRQLINRWASMQDEEELQRFRYRWTAAHACWQLALKIDRPELRRFAIRNLESLAGDRSRLVRGVVALHLRDYMNKKKQHCGDVIVIIKRLGADGSEVVQRRIAVALAALMKIDRKRATDILDGWLSGQSKHRIFTAVYTDLIGGRATQERLALHLPEREDVLFDAIRIALKSGNKANDFSHQKEAKTALFFLSNPENSELRSRLIRSLAKFVLSENPGASKAITSLIQTGESSIVVLSVDVFEEISNILLENDEALGERIDMLIAGQPERANVFSNALERIAEKRPGALAENLARVYLQSGKKAFDWLEPYLLENIEIKDKLIELSILKAYEMRFAQGELGELLFPLSLLSDQEEKALALSRLNRLCSPTKERFKQLLDWLSGRKNREDQKKAEVRRMLAASGEQNLVYVVEDLTRMERRSSIVLACICVFVVLAAVLCFYILK